ncbi:MAG: hypothetical protein Q8M57_11855 [Nitrosomonas sp.]|nr:hypothetical protein [Nitrosomonas sp.]
MQAAVNAAEKEQKEVYFRERDQRNQSFATLVEQFRQNVQETLSAIRTIVADAKLSDSQKVVLIDGVLNEKSAKPAQVEQQIDEFKQSAVKLQQGQDYFALLETRSLKLTASCRRHRVMCQHFSGHKVKQHFAATRSQRAIYIH